MLLAIFLSKFARQRQESKRFIALFRVVVPKAVKLIKEIIIGGLFCLDSLVNHIQGLRFACKSYSTSPRLEGARLRTSTFFDFSVVIKKPQAKYIR